MITVHLLTECVAYNVVVILILCVDATLILNGLSGSKVTWPDVKESLVKEEILIQVRRGFNDIRMFLTVTLFVGAPLFSEPNKSCI